MIWRLRLRLKILPCPGSQLNMDMFSTSHGSCLRRPSHMPLCNRRLEVILFLIALVLFIFRSVIYKEGCQEPYENADQRA